VKWKRREMLLAAAAAGSVKLEAQEAPNDLAALAKQTMKANLDAIGQVKLPMAVEPAFSFKA
jgi:hypothetical protein